MSKIKSSYKFQTRNELFRLIFDFGRDAVEQFGTNPNLTLDDILALWSIRINGEIDNNIIKFSKSFSYLENSCGCPIKSIESALIELSKKGLIDRLSPTQRFKKDDGSFSMSAGEWLLDSGSFKYKKKEDLPVYPAKVIELVESDYWFAIESTTLYIYRTCFFERGRENQRNIEYRRKILREGKKKATSQKYKPFAQEEMIVLLLCFYESVFGQLTIETGSEHIGFFCELDTVRLMELLDLPKYRINDILNHLKDLGLIRPYGRLYDRKRLISVTRFFSVFDSDGNPQYRKISGLDSGGFDIKKNEPENETENETEIELESESETFEYDDLPDEYFEEQEKKIAFESIDPVQKQTKIKKTNFNKLPTPKKDYMFDPFSESNISRIYRK